MAGRALLQEEGEEAGEGTQQEVGGGSQDTGEGHQLKVGAVQQQAEWGRDPGKAEDRLG